MRTKDEINRDIKVSMTDLNLLVEKSLEDEQRFEEARKGIEDHIRALKIEKSYEETPAGQVDMLIVEAKRKIKAITNDLEHATGIKFDESDT